MSEDSSSNPELEEYVASLCNQNGNADNNILDTTISCDEDVSSPEEVEIVKELKVSLDKHQCKLCCEGRFLVKKLLQFGGVLSNEYKHACDICNAGFKTKADVKKHKKLHDDGVLSEDSGFQNLSCPLNSSHNSPGANSSTPSSSRKKKNSSRPAMCDICLKIFKSQRTLAGHKRNLHSNIAYTCEVCDLKFSKHYEFKKHCKTHTNAQKYFTCSACKKKYLYKKSFKEHVCALKT